jgi:hypothetical protein
VPLVLSKRGKQVDYDAKCWPGGAKSGTGDGRRGGATVLCVPSPRRTVLTPTITMTNDTRRRPRRGEAVGLRDGKMPPGVLFP